MYSLIILSDFFCTHVNESLALFDYFCERFHFRRARAMVARLARLQQAAHLEGGAHHCAGQRRSLVGSWPWAVYQEFSNRVRDLAGVRS